MGMLKQPLYEDRRLGSFPESAGNTAVFEVLFSSGKQIRRGLEMRWLSIPLQTVVGSDGSYTAECHLSHYGKLMSERSGKLCFNQLCLSMQTLSWGICSVFGKSLLLLCLIGIIV